MTLKNEILRKSIHILFLVIPAGMMILSRSEMLWIMGVLLFIAVLVEWGRRKNAPFNALFTRLTNPMLRNHEHKAITGATYLILSGFVSILIFQHWIAQIVLLFVIISDGLSALVGKCWGRHLWMKNKTWEGNLTFLFTAFLIVVLHPDCSLPVGAIGVAAAFFVDVFITKIDDNFTIPLCSGLVMEIFSRLIQ